MSRMEISLRRKMRAYDPAKPNYPHLTNRNWTHTPKLAGAATELLWSFFRGNPDAVMGIKSQTHEAQYRTLFDISCGRPSRLEQMLEYVGEGCEELFFQPQVRGHDFPNHTTIYGHAATGRVHPSTYSTKPIAFWETFRGHYEAVWRWSHGIPIAASTARVEAMLLEFGGVLGSHLPDAYLRIPGCPIYAADQFPWPVVTMRYNGLAEEIYANEDPKATRPMFREG